MKLFERLLVGWGVMSGVCLFAHGFQAGVFFASLMFIVSTLALYGKIFLLNEPVSFEVWVVSLLALMPAYLFFLALSRDYYVKYKRKGEVKK